ncbi:MAG: hypothetical protein PHP86_07295 [Nevskiales bacterium]|nr:hypothetical protein [Nevskiales bacterium]
MDTDRNWAQGLAGEGERGNAGARVERTARAGGARSRPCWGRWRDRCIHRREQAFVARAYGQALMLYSSGQLTAAEQICRDICDRGLDTADFLRLGAVLAWRSGMRYAAEWRIRRALRLAPSSVETFICAAEIHAALGRMQEALTAARRAVRLAPEYASAFNCLGLALVQGEQLASAQRAFEIAHGLDPHDAQARHNLARLRAGARCIDDFTGVYVGSDLGRL